jgi:hypothetical protein
MASLVLCKVCLFLLLTIVVALPVAVPEKKKLLLRPYLKLPGRGDSTGNVPKSDITTVLNQLGCDYDNMLTLFYSSKGVGFLPEFRAPTPAFVHLYNGNIELLWMINNQMWLKDMCEEGVLADLSSLPFCSNLDTEDALEKGFISSMSSTLSILGFTDIIQFASDLQKLKGKEECMLVCGDRFKSVLCSAFTGLSTFLMNQVIKIDLKNYDDNTQPTSSTSPATKLSITDDTAAVKAIIDKYLQEKMNNIDPQILFSFTSPTASPSSPTIPIVAKDIAHATTDTEIPATSSNATPVTEPPTTDLETDNNGETALDGWSNQSRLPAINKTGLDDDDGGDGFGGGDPSQQGDQSQQANQQAKGENGKRHDDDESGGSGYSSIHFFSIILVLVVFTATAYLCVYHKKKIKETMKGYVSDGQKRRTRGSYKPLLSGKK